MKKKIWTDAEVAYLKDNYKVLSDAMIAAKLGVSRKTVYNKANELNLDRSINPKWIERAEKICELYRSHSYTEIASEMGISSRSVARIISALDLTRSRQEESNIRSRIRKDITAREKRRVIFGLSPLTKIKVVTNKTRIRLRHMLKKAGYLVSRGENVMYYHTEMKRDHRRENAGKSVGLSFEPWDIMNNERCINF